MKRVLMLCLFGICLSCNSQKENPLPKNDVGLNQVISKAKKEVIDSIENVKIKQKEAKEKFNNNPLNFLSADTRWEEGTGLFSKERLAVRIINHNRFKTIKNVKFQITYFSKTDYNLGTEKDMIMDFIRANEIYKRHYKLKQLPKQAAKFKIKILEAEFAR